MQLKEKEIFMQKEDVEDLNYFTIYHPCNFAILIFIFKNSVSNKHYLINIPQM